MFRASKALLSLLAVEVGLAVRQRIGASPDVLEAIGSLLASSSKHARGYAKMKDALRLASEGRETPGATESLNEILNQISADLEADVESKILDGVSSTQSAIDQSVTDLTTSTGIAVDRKTLADETDSIWLSCIGDEKAKREAVEAAVEAKNQADASIAVPCQQQADRDLFSFKPDLNLDFECSLGSGSCATQSASYTTQVNDMLANFQQDEATATANWEEAKAACEAAHADAAQKAAELATAEANWGAQRNTCLEKHEARQLDMCLFGDNLQQKCEKASAYTALISQVDQVNGGAYSQPDREGEWQTVQVVKCILAKVVDGTDPSAASLEACENSDLASLPSLDKKAAEFAEQTSVANFNCEEETITFNGETWNVPTDAAPPSSSYYKEDYSPAVDLTVGNPAFAFCSTGAPGK